MFKKTLLLLGAIAVTNLTAHTNPKCIQALRTALENTGERRMQTLSDLENVKKLHKQSRHKDLWIRGMLEPTQQEKEEESKIEQACSATAYLFYKEVISQYKKEIIEKKHKDLLN